MKKSLLIMLCLVAMLTAGCSEKQNSAEDIAAQAATEVDVDLPENVAATTTTQSATNQNIEVLQTVSSSDQFTDRDKETEDKDAPTAIVLNGQSVTIDTAGTYHLSGAIADGQIIIDVPDTDKVQLVLNGVEVVSKSSAALYVRSADKVFVTIAEGSVNTLENAGTFVNIDDNNIDGAVFSKCDISFNGAGTLNIIASSGNGLVCKDDAVFTSGNYNIKATNHGISANNSIRLTSVTMNISAGKDGLQADHVRECTQLLPLH